MAGAAEHEVATRIRVSAARLRAAFAQAEPEGRGRLDFAINFIETEVDEDIRQTVFDWWIIGWEEGTKMAEHRKSVSKIYVLISILVFFFGLSLVGGGIVLTYLGATGSSTVNLFGQTIESQTVGIPAFFIGAVVVVLLLRNVLKNLRAPSP